ncbi:GNAT family N-acetyltransferase [Mesorhizobium sp.]|uniref:GNAT family N-acetyltransferase n=1 Tax=Mesorhizobium sp. TaxID=1871066 RepID=UPI000FE9D92F|nr:GNAT family N-acetyltransferase [Mesorhizobium sp.]RWK58059.1 MAG: N-acetyltransferase [Mesorhizobium sp.]RWM40976.1 MAG: N-acetyltransferase [Mesorhizobium sp.]RWO22287.1 MAG: N-acetyltransferase [Mesorhizobium sp.]
MKSTEIEITEFGAKHLDGTLRLTVHSGWTHRREDWVMLLALGYGYVAILEGHVVGAMCMTLLGDVATIGLLIVDEKVRGRGLGEGLMKLALEKAEGRECRLIATLEGMPLYRKLGFLEIETIRTHQGTIAPVTVQDGVKWATENDFGQIFEIDRTATGLDRGKLISALWHRARFAVLRDSGKILGYAALLPYGCGEVAGPVVASSTDGFRILLSLLFSFRTGALLRIDLRPESGLGDWLSSNGLAETYSGTAMCRGEVRPDIGGPLRSYALATSQFGFP